jgi:hypothetical protein
VIPFFAFPPAIRRVLYTTNAIESLHMQLRKIIKTRGHFPSDEAAIKLLWLALRKVLAQRVRPTYDWRPVMPVRRALRDPVHPERSVIPTPRTQNFGQALSASSFLPPSLPPSLPPFLPSSPSSPSCPSSPSDW